MLYDSASDAIHTMLRLPGAADWLAVPAIGALAFLMAEGAEPAQRLKALMATDRWCAVGRLLDCSLCMGFWLGFFFTWSVPIAALVGVVAQMISNALATTRLK